MRVPIELVNHYREQFPAVLSQFAVDEKLIDSADILLSDRYLARSLVPHILKLSEMFNRMSDENAEKNSRRGRASAQEQGLDPYWKDTSNVENLRLAYFLYFMPPNAFRVSSVLAELARLGFRWPFEGPLRAIEFGAGPATGAAGILAAAEILGLPKVGEIALIEQDRAVLQLGVRWAERLAREAQTDWSFRPFHKRLTLDEPFLPKAAPKFQLWLSSYFLNEFRDDPDVILDRLLENWDRHVEDEGIIVLVEPALKLQSRRLLELRKRLIARLDGSAPTPDHRDGKSFGKKLASTLTPKTHYQVLTPCLGHQACGALAIPGDWCHEEVSWWRPGYYRKLDDMAKLDRKTLPFSYLVIAKSARPVGEILTALEKKATHRLVSPAHKVARDQEFFLCGADGKRKGRFQSDQRLDRGSILLNAKVRGDSQATRVESAEGILSLPVQRVKKAFSGGKGTDPEGFDEDAEFDEEDPE